MVEFLLGAGIGAIYVELLFRVLKRSLYITLFSYPLRVALFAIILAVLMLKFSKENAIILLLGFVFGFLLYTLLRGFVKVGVPKLS